MSAVLVSICSHTDGQVVVLCSVVKCMFDDCLYIRQFCLGIVITGVFSDELSFGLLFCVYVGHGLVCINLYVCCGQIGADCVATFCCYGMSVLFRQGVQFGSKAVGARRLVVANLWVLVCFIEWVSTGWSLVGCRAVDTAIGLNEGRFITPVNLASMVAMKV